MAELRRRYILLTAGEREVLPLVVAGLLNQADRGRTRQQGDQHSGSSWPDHAQNGGFIIGKIWSKWPGKLGIS
ncbi:MAG: hypothetical protein QOJ42_2526 [Acidobacteriaceae bacterium]|nr:hypothetical protein [Acidobacteriaceae bacterium]